MALWFFHPPVRVTGKKPCCVGQRSIFFRELHTALITWNLLIVCCFVLLIVGAFLHAWSFQCNTIRNEENVEVVFVGMCCKVWSSLQYDYEYAVLSVLSCYLQLVRTHAVEVMVTIIVVTHVALNYFSIYSDACRVRVTGGKKRTIPFRRQRMQIDSTLPESDTTTYVSAQPDDPYIADLMQVGTNGRSSRAFCIFDIIAVALQVFV